nr:hypothetical protein [uncultured Blautia sp.]
MTKHSIKQSIARPAVFGVEYVLDGEFTNFTPIGEVQPPDY